MISELLGSSFATLATCTYEPAIADELAVLALISGFVSSFSNAGFFGSGLITVGSGFLGSGFLVSGFWGSGLAAGFLTSAFGAGSGFVVSGSFGTISSALGSSFSSSTWLIVGAGSVTIGICSKLSGIGIGATGSSGSIKAPAVFWLSTGSSSSFVFKNLTTITMIKNKIISEIIVVIIFLTLPFGFSSSFSKIISCNS